jgi:hypothetical protein
VMQAFWMPLNLPAGLVNVLDVDSPIGASDPPSIAAVKAGFASLKAATFAAGGQSAVVQNYHGQLVPPFCTLAAAGFFKNF